MFKSAESRWFFEGPLPDPVRRWFEGDGPVRNEATRTDEYLLLPHCATTGVKLREGNFEVKAMTRAPQPTVYANGVSGYRDAWVKWSCKAEDAEGLRRMLGAGHDRWAAVSKTRRLRLYALDGSTPVALEDGSARVANGCQVELTALRISVGALSAVQRDDGSAPAAWWSLSLEAFAHDAPDATATAMAHLTDVANHLFRSPPPCPIVARNARSYPAWLLTAA